MSIAPERIDGARRALCIAALAGTALGLAACTGLGPRTVELSQARLQELVARHFPVDRRLLDAFDLTLDSPRVGLQPEANRISVEVALRAQGGGPIQTRLSGSLLVSESLRFEPSDNTIRLVDVQVERFVIDGLPASWQRQLDRIGKPLARGLLEDQVIYTLRPKDVAGLEGRGLRPGDLRVTASGVEIALVPVVR
jgi:hypothetical protein